MRKFAGIGAFRPIGDFHLKISATHELRLKGINFENSFSFLFLNVKKTRFNWDFSLNRKLKDKLVKLLLEVLRLNIAI